MENTKKLKRSITLTVEDKEDGTSEVNVSSFGLNEFEKIGLLSLLLEDLKNGGSS